jgi:predicted metal-dependent HD superfamily phosphohydrolase
MSGSKRSIVRRNSSGDAAAHAWGEHDVGYDTGNRNTSRDSPANSSGRRLSKKGAAAIIPSMIWWASSTKP